MRVKDLYNWAGALDGQTVRTQGYTRENDGAAMSWRMQREKPAEALYQRISVPTANGGWAVPTGVPTAPPRAPYAPSAEDMIRRGWTFQTEGGKDLIWEGTGRQGPLWGGVPVHRRYQKPYPITCSHFTGMLMMGWVYGSTTYKIDEPYSAGWYIPLEGLTATRAEIWQAHRQARWFYNHGDLWLSDGSDMARGDIVFFSEQNPEKQNDRVKAGTGDAYFGNIFHVAQYLGGGKLLQAATPTSPTGVYEEPWEGYLKGTTSWVARPSWAPPKGTHTSLWDGEKEVLVGR